MTPAEHLRTLARSAIEDGMAHAYAPARAKRLRQEAHAMEVGARALEARAAALTSLEQVAKFVFSWQKLIKITTNFLTIAMNEVKV